MSLGSTFRTGKVLTLSSEKTGLQYYKTGTCGDKEKKSSDVKNLTCGHDCVFTPLGEHYDPRSLCVLFS